MTTVGEALVADLAARGTEVVFGIPGVHTLELYRGLAGSSIRHVTARHEASAVFMADGHARVTGRPGVAFVITGPGLTNALTPIAQARADSVPLVVIAGVNEKALRGRGLGHLHELPDQLALARTVALRAEEIARPAELLPALDAVFAAATRGRGGPAILQIPIDVMGQLWPARGPGGTAAGGAVPHLPTPPPEPDMRALARAQGLLSAAERPVILAGGGARGAEDALRRLAETLDAPVVLTVNARGLLHGHALAVPASPSLAPVRRLLGRADAIVAIGTELGPTDYDMYRDGGLPDLSGMIRIDIDAAQLARHRAAVTIQADAGRAAVSLCARLAGGQGLRRGAVGAAKAETPATTNRAPVSAPETPGAIRAPVSAPETPGAIRAPVAAPETPGAERARETRNAARAALPDALATMVDLLGTIRDACPGAIIVGDSTQPVYAGNLYHDHDRPGGWFNAATGYGALGYGAPAAIGAALAAPDAPVICLTGDGGLQFSLAELLTARQEGARVTFLIWNNAGYREIADAMRGADIDPIGCDPAPPEFDALARAMGLPHRRIAPDAEALAAALRAAHDGPRLIEIALP